jgi:hypothetical protein
MLVAAHFIQLKNCTIAPNASKINLLRRTFAHDGNAYVLPNFCILPDSLPPEWRG